MNQKAKLTLAVEFVRVIATIVLAVATIRLTDALEILARKFRTRTGMVMALTFFSLIGAVTAVVVVVAQPALNISGHQR